jgi:hypothetical protein
MVDIALVAVLGIVTWMVANDGAWSAAITFLCTLLAGLLAMNFFEPLAIILSGFLREWDSRWDMISLLGLFAGFTFGLRTITEQLAPTYIQVPGWVDNGGRWLFGAATGYLTAAILLTALHTAPLPREFAGFQPERLNLFNIAAPDRQWLGFVQYVTEKPLARFDVAASGQPGVPHAFDGKHELVGDPAVNYPNQVWPSFPMRYAARRDMLAGVMAAVPSPPPVIPSAAGAGTVGNPGAPGAAPPVVTPVSPAGNSGGGTAVGF